MSDSILRVTIGAEPPPRLDKALARDVPEEAALSRTRLAKLIDEGAVRHAGQVVTNPKVSVAEGDVIEIALPEVTESHIEAEKLPLDVRYEDADRLRPFGGKVGQVHCDKFPRDIRRILPFEDMDTLDDSIVSQDKCFVAEFDYGCVVLKTAGLRGSCERAQGGDEIRFVQRPASLATASRMPFTNLASRSSKNAFATSTYSLIAAALGTSARAISS